jgi:hypothetical protein
MPMVARNGLAVLLASLLAFPGYGDPSAVGSFTGGQSASIRGVSLSPGATVFSGDAIEVGTGGSARIALAGGSQVQVGQESQIRLEKTSNRVQLFIDRGIASFRTGGDSGVEALLADATIRSADGTPAVGIVQIRSPQAAVIAAQKGALVISIAHDGKNVVLREGDGAEVTLAQDTQQTEQQKNKKKKPAGVALPAGSMSTGKVVLIAAIIGGVATAIGLLLAQNETQQSDKDKCNAVSPFKCP